MLLLFGRSQSFCHLSLKTALCNLSRGCKHIPGENLSPCHLYYSFPGALTATPEGGFAWESLGGGVVFAQECFWKQECSQLGLKNVNSHALCFIVGNIFKWNI